MGAQNVPFFWNRFFPKLNLGDLSGINSWNPNDPCFDWKGPCFGGLTFKNRGHLGSRQTLDDEISLQK